MAEARSATCLAAMRSSTFAAMRIVWWNCCQGFDRNLLRLHELGCDVGMLAEVPQAPPEQTLLTRAPSWHWCGDTANKGLAVAGFGHETVHQPPTGLSGQWSQAVVLPELGLGLLAIWSCPAKPSLATYGAAVSDSITAHAEFLRSRPCVVAGDFNMAPRGAGHRPLEHVFEQLDELGYRSVYHHRTGEPFGEESVATYFHQRKVAAPFHIDFMFCSESLLDSIVSFEVGSYGDYVEAKDGVTGVSDHVPLVLDLNLQPS